MADNNQVVLLRVQLDEGKTEAQLQKLVLDMEATRKAQAALTLARKNDQITTDEYAKQTVALTAQLKGQRTEYAAQAKNLELFRTATGDLANTYKGTQAQLSLAQKQYQQLQGSQNNSTESTKALGATIAELRTELTKTDETQGLFVRNIGNYPKGESLQPLVAQLVRVEELMKSGTLTAQQSAEADRAVIGFKSQIAQAAAKEGKSYEETTNFVKEYGAAIRPATQALIGLEKEQQQVAEGSEAFNQIGFKIAAASKQIQSVPGEVKGVTDTITELDATTGAFGGQVANLKQRFAQAKQGIDLAKSGFTGLKGAIAGTGIGLLILALGALYEYFTKTDEGAEDLAAALAFLKGGFSVLEGVVIGVGKGLVTVFTNPKQAASDLLDFVEGQVVNRVKAIGTIFNGLTSGDFKGAAAGLADYVTGVENTTGKVKALGEEASRAARAAYEISRANDALEDSERESLVTLEKNKNLIDQLVLTSKDRTLSEQQRLANLDKAGKLEKENLQTSLDLARQRFEIASQENAEAERVGKTSDELRDKVAQAQADYTRLAGQSASLLQSIQNRRSSLLQQEAADEKAAADKAAAAAAKAEEARLQLRRDGLALEAQLLDRQLTQVKANSDEELNILQLKLRNSYQAELNVKNLTVSAKKAIDAKYENDSLKLASDFNKQRILAAYDAAVAANAQELALVRKGTQEETELRVEAINTQLAKELAALDQRKDNAAQEAQLRATAARAINDTRYTAAQANLEKYLQGERNALDEAFAKNKIREEDYNKAVLTSDVTAAAARLQLAKSFTQDETALEQQLTAAKIAGIKAVGEKEREEQARRVAQAQSLAEGLTSLFADTVATTGATMEDFARKALILLIDSVEKSIVAAEIKILVDSFAQADSIASFGITGALRAAAIIGVVTAASETLKAKLQPTTQQFADGTVLGGASHAQGGVQLYSRSGYHFGEAEKDEIILTKGVFQNPLLRQAASALNVLGGGKPLAPSTYMALGGISSTAARDQLRPQPSAAIDYKQLAAACAKLNIYTKTSDTNAARERDAFTKSMSNS